MTQNSDLKKTTVTTNKSSEVNNTKMAATEPKIVRKLLPFAAFLITFATVMTILIVYMDTTAMRHRQFQINMTQDYDMGVAQDNDELILYVREFLIRPAINYSVMGHLNPHTNYLTSTSMHRKEYNIHEVEPTKKEKFVAQFFMNKKNGVFIETGAYRHERLSDTEWLERNLSWSGLLIQTYPKDLFNLLNRGRIRSKCIHACLSTEPHPKEITIPSDSIYDDNVKINSILQTSSIDDVTSNDVFDWFATRIKCFPLYSLILAMNVTTTLDFLNIETFDCNEFNIIQTLPFDKLKIKLISIHFKQQCGGKGELSFSSIKRFMDSRSYKFAKSFGDDYLFWHTKKDERTVL